MTETFESQKKLGEKLLAAGLLSPEGLAQALDRQTKVGGRIGDLLVELKLISEQSLLRFLAMELKTRFVATDKLSKVKIPQEVLDRLPVRLAEQQVVLPLMVDAERRILSVVMAEPQNLAAVAEIQILSDMAEVYAYVGLRSAILAGIKKHYYGDPTAFAVLDEALARGDLSALSGAMESSRGVAPASVSRVTSDTNPRGRAGTDPRARASGLTGASATSVRAQIDELHRGSLTSENDYVETLHIMVGLLEMRRKEMKGHSAAVARGTRSISLRMGLPPREVNFNTIAAYLHDLGKRPDRHLTLFSIGANDEYKADARRYFRTPIKLFETVHLPVQVNQVLAHVYEAYDGSGLPEARALDAIPIGARIIAAIDAFEDLSKNAQNHLGRLLGRDEALQWLVKHQGKLFDPKVVEAIQLLHSGELLRERLLADYVTAVFVDGDEAALAPLAAALKGKGVHARHVTGSDAALEMVRSGEVDLVVSEIDLPQGDGFAIANALRQLFPEGTGVPLVFLSHRNDPTSIERGLALGAADYLLKPYDASSAATKIRRIVDEKSQGTTRMVHGHFEEMSLPDVTRTIVLGKRTGQLAILGAPKTAELWFDGGRLVQAAHGSIRGEPALFELLELEAGEFRFDPGQRPADAGIERDAEVLLREHVARRQKAARDP